MNFKSIEFNLPNAREQINGFKVKLIEDKKNNFFIFGKTSKQSGFQINKSPKLTKRQTVRDQSPKNVEFSGDEHKSTRPKSSYILKKKVWIDNRNKKKVSTSKNLINAK